MAPSVKRSNTGNVNLCEGSVLKKLIIFALPFVSANVLQVLFNTADVAILGVFIKDVERANLAVAAVGSTAPFVNLAISIVIGLSVGANVVLSRCVGENNQEKAARVVSTSILLCLISSLIVTLIGFFFAKDFLLLMKCDAEVLCKATTYLKIYFLGMPVMMLYNFSSSILRAGGNTLKPFYFLLIGGLLNVGLNIFITVVFNTDVEGVALATVISQAVSALLAFICLLKNNDFSRLDLRRLKIYKEELFQIVKVGLPTGIHTCVFSISNMFVQSAVNVLGKTYMAGYAISTQIDTIFYQVLNSVAVASLTFVSQNLGAKKLERIHKTTLTAILVVTAMGVVLGGCMGLFGKQICSIMSKDPIVVDIAYRRLLIVGVPFFICGIMEVFANVTRGMGKSFGAMTISLFCNCIIRIIWLNTIYLLFPKYDILLWAFPVTWIITILAYIVYYICVTNNIKKQIKADNEDEEV